MKFPRVVDGMASTTTSFFTAKYYFTADVPCFIYPFFS